MAYILKALAGLFLALVLAIGALVAFAFGTEHRPAPMEAVSVEGSADQPRIRSGVPFKLVSWNLQYGASRKHRFFYDGGEAVHVPAADVEETVAAIAQVLSDEAPAVALLQEIDRDSARTGRKDQLPRFVSAMGARQWASTPYHLSPFVPKPFDNPLGRVHLALGILSSGPLAQATRHQLALMDEPRLFQAFNLKRALLTAEIPVEGYEQPLAVAVTHLSAFSYGDGTLEKQVDALAQWMRSRPEGQPWILAGDMNLLPPNDDPKRLSVESELYADSSNPIEKLIPAFQELFGENQLAPEVRTYLPFGYSEPDRKIDYVFVGGPVHIVSARVMREHSAISDHLPVLAELVVGQAPEPPAPAVPEAAEGAPSTVTE